MLKFLRELEEEMARIDPRAVLKAQNEIGVPGARVLGKIPDELLQLQGVVAKRRLEAVRDGDVCAEKLSRPGLSVGEACSLIREYQEKHHRAEWLEGLFWGALESEFPEAAGMNMALLPTGDVVVWKPCPQAMFMHVGGPGALEAFRREMARLANMS